MKSEESERPDAAANVPSAAISRRDFLKGAGISVASPVALGEAAQTAPEGGTPEQIHLTFGDDPSRTAFVSWASPAQATNPRVVLHPPHGTPRVVHALQRTYTDGLNGQTVFTYHAKLEGLDADVSYRYAVTADNDGGRRTPFAA